METIIRTKEVVVVEIMVTLIMVMVTVVEVVVTMAMMRIIRKKRSCKTLYHQLLSVKNLMSSGLMWLDLNRLNLHFKKPLYYQQDSLNSLLENVNPGEVFYSMDLQVPVNPIWLKPVLLKLMEPSLVSLVLI
jgi:sorbitol-specific phosphotransferase system component IIC